jgi:hypothetical protein
MGTENFFGFPGSFMCIGESINGPVQGDPVLNALWKIKFLLSFHKIADQVTHQYFGVIKRQICVGQVIDKEAI